MRRWAPSGQIQSSLYLGWTARRAVPSATLTVVAVPSKYRAEIRKWIAVPNPFMASDLVGARGLEPPTSAV